MTSVLEHCMSPFLSAAESRCPISASHSKGKEKYLREKTSSIRTEHFLFYNNAQQRGLKSKDLTFLICSCLF